MCEGVDTGARYGRPAYAPRSEAHSCSATAAFTAMLCRCITGWSWQQTVQNADQQRMEGEKSRGAQGNWRLGVNI